MLQYDSGVHYYRKSSLCVPWARLWCYEEPLASLLSCRQAFLWSSAVMHRQRQLAHWNNHRLLTTQHVDLRLHLHRMSQNFTRQSLKLVTLNLLVANLTSILLRFESVPRRLLGFLKTRPKTIWSLKKQPMFCPFLSVLWKRRSFLWPLAFLSQCAYGPIIAALISSFALNLLSVMAEADRINSLRLSYLY